MKPLRELAKGYRRIVDKFGTPWIVREFYYCAERRAPASCFADAPEEPLREGERVVGVDEPMLEDGKTPSILPGCARKHGVLLEIYQGHPIGFVRFDDDTTRSEWLFNLRREREDERPGEYACYPWNLESAEGGREASK